MCVAIGLLSWEWNSQGESEVHSIWKLSLRGPWRYSHITAFICGKIENYVGNCLLNELNKYWNTSELIRTYCWDTSLIILLSVEKIISNRKTKLLYIHYNAATSDVSIITEVKAAIDRFPKGFPGKGLRDQWIPNVSLEDPIPMKAVTNHRKSKCTIHVSTGRLKPDDQWAGPHGASLPSWWR